MSNYRSRPKGNYIQDASWQDLYILIENWKNDLEFYQSDLEFLDRLIEAHFVKLLLLQNIYDLRELQRDLDNAKTQCKNLLIDSDAHLITIIDILELPSDYEATIFRQEFEQFEDQISDFITVVKIIRKTVFNITKDVLENQKSKYVWKFN